VDPIFSLNRSAWNELCLPSERNGFKPPVKSVVIKKRNARRGIRLVVFASAKSYFDRLHAEQGAADSQAGHPAAPE